MAFYMKYNYLSWKLNIFNWNIKHLVNSLDIKWPNKCFFYLYCQEKSHNFSILVKNTKKDLFIMRRIIYKTKLITSIDHITLSDK